MHTKGCTTLPIRHQRHGAPPLPDYQDVGRNLATHSYRTRPSYDYCQAMIYYILLPNNNGTQANLTPAPLAAAGKIKPALNS